MKANCRDLKRTAHRLGSRARFRPFSSRDRERCEVGRTSQVAQPQPFPQYSERFGIGRDQPHSVRFRPSEDNTPDARKQSRSRTGS